MKGVLFAGSDGPRDRVFLAGAGAAAQ